MNIVAVEKFFAGCETVTDEERLKIRESFSTRKIHAMFLPTHELICLFDNIIHAHISVTDGWRSPRKTPMPTFLAGVAAMNMLYAQHPMASFAIKGEFESTTFWAILRNHNNW